ncbi:DrmE family protein [Cohnella hongkongensis]|uniref:DrmE family protein n=1 Tax=Cohnella hongkongensis TaxID=178337 RepID=A0ABV9FIJ5_9BACL
MSKSLNTANILNAIRPDRLLISDSLQDLTLPGLLDFVNDFSYKDLGRGMLNHDLFCLVETLTTFENDEEGTTTAKVQTSDLDNILLSLSLKAFLKSKKTSHKCNLAFLTPPFSYSFPLMLSYHLILQHLAEKISPELSAKFPPGTGILIISDNIELYSHIGRTSIQSNQLWQYINTYEVKANRFKKFTFSKDTKHVQKNDGSLPWISLFRAVRRQLPEQLDMLPQVIIVDVQPLRHRKRIAELLEWAKKFAPHIIVIAPLFDDGVYQSIKKHMDLVIPIDSYGVDYLRQVFQLRDQIELNPVTASWSLSASQSYIQLKDSIDVYLLKGVNALEELVKEIDESLSITRHKDGQQHPVFRKLKSLVNDMLSLPVPLEIYEQVREINGKSKLLDIVKATLKVTSEEEADRKLIAHILPQLVRDIVALYELLYGHPRTPKGEALLRLLHTIRNEQVTVVVANNFAAQELKLWIRMQTKWTAKEAEYISVITQDQWAKNQLKEIYLEDNKAPDHVVLLSPWKLKYIGAFFIHAKSKVSCISYEHEINLYRYQINKAFGQNNGYIEDLIHSLLSIPKVDLTSLRPLPTKRTNVFVRTINVKPMNASDFVASESFTSIDTLFEDEMLLGMLGEQEEQEIDEDDDNSVIPILSDMHIEDTVVGDRIICVKITGKTSHQNDNQLVWFVPSEVPLKIVKKSTLESMSPLAAKPGDSWIILKKNQRRELFETILKLSSNTMIMKWIEFNVAEWRDMLNLLWNHFHKPHNFKKHTYESIRKAIQEHGGNVETTYTIANWINGDVSSVKNAANVRAVAKIIGEQGYLEKWKTIYKAMRRLWNIHIQLGQVLGVVISDIAAQAATDYASEWVEVGKDIKLPLDDIMASIELVEILKVESEKDYHVPSTYIEKAITEQMAVKLIKKGLIGFE